jgi:hypothetical protein
MTSTTVDFCGEKYTVDSSGDLTIGREADLVIDDNPFLHRRFLRIFCSDGMWWIANVGSHLAATLADDAGMVQAWLAPGAQLPLVFQRSSVWFTAGPTTYEFHIALSEAPFAVVQPEGPVVGSTTYGRTTLTPDQRLLVIALAEPMLRRPARGVVDAPSSAEAADRLGWTITKFNRKLDNVCQKLDRNGVRGLHGGPDRLASDRKARLVEYALATRMVGADDLELLDAPLSVIREG